MPTEFLEIFSRPGSTLKISPHPIFAKIIVKIKPTININIFHIISPVLIHYSILFFYNLIELIIRLISL